MGKRCCRGSGGGGGCCGCCGSCCCCCGRRAATVLVSLVGLALAAAAIAPPVYVHYTDGNYDQLFPAFRLARNFLLDATQDRDESEGRYPVQRSSSNNNGFVEEEITVVESANGGSTFVEIDEQRTTPRDKYRLAIFQLLDDVESKSRELAMASFVFGCVNVPIHFLLLIGALSRTPCLMLPWLAVTLLEHVILGVPAIVFVGIVALYLSAQLYLHLCAAAIMGSVVLLFLLWLSSWFTVHSCYAMFYRRQQDYYYDGGVVGTCNDSAQPLLNTPTGRSGGRGPAPPPGHPNGGGYPQYYPPHHQNRQLPSAPPSGSLYPQLA